MVIIKKLDLYILKKFLPLFVGSFFICLFVFMMQFTWRYIDELIGKGLSLDILAQFFWYMGISLIPMSLPLAVLLASLITFGNMGEQLELLSMKTAGVPLIRIMRPILILVAFLTGLSFYFQNTISPKAQIDMRTLLISMKQASPAVEIPEGVFYNGIPNVNLYVQKKNANSGMLYQMIIYKTDQGFDRAQIVLADSGRMEMSSDKLHLKLEMWSGEQFENLQQQNMAAINPAGSPYDRETFQYKRFIIDFDANFALMDANMLRDMASAKSMPQIEHSVDSMNARLDSVGKVNYEEFRSILSLPPAGAKVKAVKSKLPFDSIIAGLSPSRLQDVKNRAASDIRQMRSDLEWKSVPAETTDALIRRHWVEWHQKMTLSLACLFFFFVGAPLGAIIRKGGLGMPAVISVLIFIFYYIINTSGMKMARDGSWNMVYGMWISSAVLIPFGVFLTYKANRDSMVFNGELYLSIIRRILGFRTARHFSRKEVIIHDPDYAEVMAQLEQLKAESLDYKQKANLKHAPNYVNIFFHHKADAKVEDLNERMEQVVEELSNSRSASVIAELNRLPVIYVHAHTSPFSSHWANVVSGSVFPVGVVLWLRIWRFRLRLLRDVNQIVKSCGQLEYIINREINHEAQKEGYADNSETEAAAPIKSAHGKIFDRFGGKKRTVIIALLSVIVVALLAFFGYGLIKKHKLKEAGGKERIEKTGIPGSPAPENPATLPARLPSPDAAPAMPGAFPGNNNPRP